MSKTNQELMGEVEAFLSQDQRYVLVNVGKQTVIRGGRRSGKSTLCCAIILHRMLKEKCNISCVSMNEVVAKKVEMDTFISLCENIGVPYFSKNREVHLLNGSTVLFKGLNESPVGTDVSLIVYPELDLANIPESIKDLSIPFVVAGDYPHNADSRCFDIGENYARRT